MWKSIIEPNSPQLTICRMRIASWIPRATNTNSEYVTLTAFPLPQRLHERTSMLRYMNIACLARPSQPRVWRLYLIYIGSSLGSWLPPFRRKSDVVTVNGLRVRERELIVGQKWCYAVGQTLQRLIIIIIIIIIIINCNWVVTRWQWLFYMYTKYEIGYC